MPNVMLPENQITKKRTPRLQRVATSTLNQFRLTDRDIEILYAVYTHRALTTNQIGTLLFPSAGGEVRSEVSSRCRRRLQYLYHHGYLHRAELLKSLHDGSRPFVYLLDRQSIPILVQKYKLSADEVNWRPHHNRIGSLFLNHLIACNDFRIAVEVAVQKDEYELAQWIDESTLRRQRRKEKIDITTPSGIRRQITLIPDGYFQINANGYCYPHFLEVDMGTETVMGSDFGRKDFARKLLGYKAYYESGRYTASYDSTAMRVLIVTNSVRRLINLMKAAEMTKSSSFCMFAVFDDVMVADTVVSSPIWRTDTEGRVCLVTDANLV